MPIRTTVNIMPDPGKLFDQFHQQLRRLDGPAVYRASTPDDEGRTRNVLFDIVMCLNTCVGVTEDEQGNETPAADWEHLNMLIRTLNEQLHDLARHHDQRHNCEHRWQNGRSARHVVQKVICRECGVALEEDEV